MMKILKIGVVCVLFLTGCSGAYYGAMEKIGIHKREILADRVAAARDSQQQAKEQFASALERFSTVVNFSGGQLEDQYRQLREELDDSEDRAADVRERIAAVEDVAEALFAEWERELDAYTSSRLRDSSEEQLTRTREDYQRLIATMKKAEAKIDPVLNPLRDQVLFLKHNLNARAIGTLQGELSSIETDVARLVRDMEAAIAEADRFIQALEGS